jgi:hypothetical protein
LFLCIPGTVPATAAAHRCLHPAAAPARCGWCRLFAAAAAAASGTAWPWTLHLPLTIMLLLELLLLLKFECLFLLYGLQDLCDNAEAIIIICN